MSYQEKYSAPAGTSLDYDTDDDGALIVTDFSDRSKWIRYNEPSLFAQTINPDGSVSIATLGADANVQIGFSGVILRKKLFLDAAGLLDLSIHFSAVDISNPAAAKEICPCLLLAINGVGGVDVLIGIRATSGIVTPHGIYGCIGSPNYLQTLQSRGTSTADMAANIASCTLRFQVEHTIPAGLTPQYLSLNNVTATYQHNGAGAVAFGGALDTTLRVERGMALSQGLVLMAGVWNNNQHSAARTQTFDRVTLHAGRMIGS